MKSPGSDPRTGLAVLKAFLKEKSPLGPLRVMAERVGRFFQVPLPFFNPYIVFGPEAVRKVLVTERRKFLWRNHDPVADLLQRGVLVTDGEEHDRYRALMEPALHPGQLPRYTEMMREQARRISATWQDGQVIDMLVEARKIALLIIIQALFSRDAWHDLPRIWTPILKAIEYISPGAWILWRKIPRPGYKKHLQALDAYLYEIIAERRKSILDTRYSIFDIRHSNPRISDYRISNFELSNIELSNIELSNNDLLQHLIDAGLPDDIIRDQMLTMLIAGHDTSTALLAWVFALLGQHPETYTELQRQLAETSPDKTPPLLDQVIKETLRLYPPIHIGNRIVAQNVTFGEGQTIPAGARMFYSIYLTHRDPQIWENPDQFQPERFAHGRQTPPMAYIPFGGGPRACIGAAFGQMEARLVLRYLLETFEFVPASSVPPVSSVVSSVSPLQKSVPQSASPFHPLSNPFPHMGATLEPRPGVFLRITRRNPKS